MNSVLLDTNILIYSLDKSSSFHEESVHLLKNSTFQLFITTKVVAEYFAVCSKLVIDSSVILGFYGELRKNSSLIYPNADSIVIFEKMIVKYKPKGNRVYDLEIASVAAAYGIDFLASFNRDDFKDIDEIKLLSMFNP